MAGKSPIQTLRLVLEDLEPAHAEALFDGLCDRNLYEFIDDDPPASVEALRSRYERLAVGRSPDGTEIWLNRVVLTREDGRVLGFVQATVSSDQTAEIAFLIFRKFWGSGYGQESALAMIKHLSDAYNVKIFRARVDPRNHRSIALLESLNFAKTGCPIGFSTVQDSPADEWEFVLNQTR